MYIAVEIGGTNTRIGASHKLHDVSGFVRFPTAKTLVEQVYLTDKVISEVFKGEDVDAFVLGVAGTLDHKREVILNAPNCLDISGKRLSQLIPVKYRNTMTYFANDAALSAYGEAVEGAGRKYRRVGYISLGTGVGGALIINKNVQDIFTTFEPGHMIIYENGRKSHSCSHTGCLEAYASGHAFKEIYGISPLKCTDKRIWKKYAGHLAIGVANLINTWSPDVLVFGGGLSDKFEFFFEPLITSIAKLTYQNLPSIVSSKFGDRAGIIGAFSLLKNIDAS